MAIEPTTDESLRAYAHLCEQIHAAFDHVALSMSCTVAMLLEETRSRGLKDSDVCNVLSLDALNSAAGEYSDMHFECGRSNAGVLYITRDTAARNDRTFAFEAFAEALRAE